MQQEVVHGGGVCPSNLFYLLEKKKKGCKEFFPTNKVFRAASGDICLEDAIKKWDETFVDSKWSRGEYVWKEVKIGSKK